MKIIKENKKSEENEEKVACVKLVVVGFSLGQMRYESSFSSTPKRSHSEIISLFISLGRSGNEMSVIC